MHGAIAGIVGARLDVDEQGDARVVVLHTTHATARAVTQARTSHRQQRAAVWHAHPVCVDCGQRIPTVEDAAVVALSDGDRVACRAVCFSRAVQRLIEAMG